MPDPLDVASGPRRRSLAQIGSGGSSFLDKDQFLSTTTWPTRRAGSSQMEQRLPSSGLHWMTCVPTRHLTHARTLVEEVMGRGAPVDQNPITTAVRVTNAYFDKSSR